MLQQGIHSPLPDVPFLFLSALVLLSFFKPYGHLLVVHLHGKDL
jgi:hypothetical protein